MFCQKNILQAAPGIIFYACCISSAFAVDEPNGNYSSLILSYRSSTFAKPVCVGTECHSGLSGPAVAFSQQIIPNLAIGLSGSDLQSNGTSSTLRATGSSVFLQVIAGIGRFVDVGAAVAALHSGTRVCLLNPSLCTSTDDTGRDLGIFGLLFLNNEKSTSISLSYDSIAYQNLADQSIAGLSLVTVLAEHHRLAVSIDQTQDSSGKAISSGLGFGYSYLF